MVLPNPAECYLIESLRGTRQWAGYHQVIFHNSVKDRYFADIPVIQRNAILASSSKYQARFIGFWLHEPLKNFLVHLFVNLKLYDVSELEFKSLKFS